MVKPGPRRRTTSQRRLARHTSRRSNTKAGAQAGPPRGTRSARRLLDPMLCRSQLPIDPFLPLATATPSSHVLTPSMTVLLENRVRHCSNWNRLLQEGDQLQVDLLDSRESRRVMPGLPALPCHEDSRWHAFQGHLRSTEGSESSAGRAEVATRPERPMPATAARRHS